MTLQKSALFYRTIVLLAFDLKTYGHTEKSKSNLSLVGVGGRYQRKIKLKAFAWIAKYHKNTLFSPTKQINMGIFCLRMSSKAPISSTQELPAQKHSESCSSCLWIKQLLWNQQEPFATLLCVLVGITGMLLIPHASGLHASRRIWYDRCFL